MNHILESFSPPIGDWFHTRFGEPTPPQVAGWPAIQRGDHTLILAPTGSGKTMAAFLWGIDTLRRVEGEEWRVEVQNSRIHNQETGERKQPRDKSGPGIQIVYISPLKALNNDIERNLRVPLAGIRKQAQEMGLDLPRISVAVRSGDTPQRERQAMLQRPPHILITTPESLYLMLTSPNARGDLPHGAHGDRGRDPHPGRQQARRAPGAEPGTVAAPGRRSPCSASASRPPSSPLDEVARFLGGKRVG